MTEHLRNLGSNCCKKKRRSKMVSFGIAAVYWFIHTYTDSCNAKI